jgi:acetolactate synthase-1/2/3 large subunit
VVPEDHPMTLGGLNGNGMPGVQDFYATCDLMLVAGSRLRGHESGDFSVKLPGPLVQIDVDPVANGRTYAVTQFVHGDAKATLEALLARVGGKLAVDPGFAGDFAKMKAGVQESFRASLGPYADFPRQLRAAMPRDALWVRDITLSNSTWGNRLFPVYGPRDSIYPVGAGIGLGLHLGIGAAMAAGGRKTMMMSGDGGFFLNVTELWTAVQEDADMVMIVMNDRGYGVIKHIQDALYGGRRFFGDLHSPDLGGLAALAGIPFFRVDRADVFGATVAQAIAHRGPSLVEVDMTAIGAFPPYYPYDGKRS